MSSEEISMSRIQFSGTTEQFKDKLWPSSIRNTFWKVKLRRLAFSTSVSASVSSSDFRGGIQQRWSRGHKARGQGQGHKKNLRPRPRTAFPRTDTLEAKDRNARGQDQEDQGHRHKCSPKKSLQKFFSGDLQFIGVPRIFDLRGLNHKSHEMTSSKFFQRGSFCGTKIS